MFLPLVVLAQEAAPVATELDLMALLGAFVRAIQSGQWPVVAVLGFVVAIWVLRKGGARWIPWLLRSKIGGPALATVTGELDPEDPHFGLIPLGPAQTTGRGRAASYVLDLEASNGANVHVAVRLVHITDR